MEFQKSKKRKKKAKKGKKDIIKAVHAIAGPGVKWNNMLDGPLQFSINQITVYCPAPATAGYSNPGLSVMKHYISAVTPHPRTSH